MMPTVFIPSAWINEVVAQTIAVIGVHLTDQQAHQLLASETDLREDIYKSGGSLSDTYSRDLLVQAVVDAVLSDYPVPKGLDHRGIKSWYWPVNSSSAKYIQAFFRNFITAARDKGYRLANLWDPAPNVPDE